jgi:hypothetical protein
MRKITFACLMTLLILGCVAQSGENIDVIGYLKTNEHTITLQLGPNDQQLYTVRTHAGHLLADSLPETELVAKLPQLKTLIEEGMADDDGLIIYGEGNVPSAANEGLN